MHFTSVLISANCFFLNGIFEVFMIYERATKIMFRSEPLKILLVRFSLVAIVATEALRVERDAVGLN